MNEVLYSTKFEALTPHTIICPNDLVGELRKIRKVGWSIDDEEYKLEHRCISAPVYNYRGDAIAAVGVSGTTENIPPERIEYIAEQVVAAAKDISRRMGYMD